MKKGTGTQLMLQMAAANRNLRNELEISFKNIGLTVNEAMVIRFVASAPGKVYPKDIETHLQVTLPSVSRILRDMKAKDYITTEPDLMDGRCKCIELTAQTREKVAQINDQIACFDRILAQVLSEEENAALMNLLEKLT